jgi:cytochrome c biogenesis protein CcmG/thiol:disulfide interchange protein DsbE
MSGWLRFAPLALIALVIAGMAWRLLSPADNEVRSKLEGQALPAVALAAGVPGKPGLKTSDLASGAPRIVNIFASWCVPCITEVRLLSELQRRGVAIDGIAVRDRPEDIANFLSRYGDPYQRIGSDPQSAIQIALGSAGVPESFIVDGRGVIRYQHIGAIEASDVPAILARLEAAK